MDAAHISQRLERLPISWVHRKLLLIHGCGWLFDAMDVGIITFVLAALATDWNLAPGQVGLIASAGMAGMFVGAAFSGVAADVWGRKTVFQVTLLIFSVATLLCALSWNYTSMLVFRFIVGVGLGGELPVVASLLSEFLPAKSRGRYIVLLESFWGFGWLLAAIVAYKVIPAFGWRSAFFIGSIPALYVWFLRQALPESPRWLAAKGRLTQANAVMSQLETETVRLTGSTLEDVQATGIVSDSAPTTRLKLGALWSAEYRRRTIMLWLLWFGLVFGYYGIFVWLPTLLIRAGYPMVKSFEFVLIITLAQLPGYFSAAYLVERIGRKMVIVGYLVASAVTAYLFGNASSTTMILVWGSLMSFFNLGAWGAVYSYTPELYPTLARTTGAGSAAAFGRIGGIIAPFAVGMLLPSLGRSGVLALNAGALLVAGIVVAVLGEETRARRLEEIST